MIEYNKYISTDNQNNPIWLFKQSEIKENKTSIKTQTDKETEKEKHLICRTCKNIITSTDDIFEIDGQHCHSFTNPAGIKYKIGCFLSAVGCANQGEYTEEYSWFPGFAWCFSLCSNCFTHLGWHYRSNGNTFYGLILDQLQENT